MKRNLFSIRLKELREESGYTSQQKLADTLDVSQSTIGNWEAGRRQPDYDMICRLAGLFHVSVDYLIGNVNDPFFSLDNQSVLDDINEQYNEKKAPTAGESSERDELAGEILEELLKLPPKSQEEARKYIRFLAQQASEENS